MPPPLLTARPLVNSHPLRFAALLTLLLAAAGCDALGLGDGHFSETRLYSFDFFESHDACAAAQPDPDFWYNCSQTVTFCPGGEAEVMVTDIVHGGRYKRINRTLQVTLRENPEVSQVLRFRLSEDGGEITEEETGTVFVRKFGEELGYAEQSCAWKG
jgi:hypothetical protein